MSLDFLFMVKPSLIPTAGVGCFTMSDIPQGSRVNTKKEQFRHLAESEIPDEYLKYCVLLDSGHYLFPEDFLRMNVFWYINHQKEPNLIFEKGTLFAKRDLQKGEELSLYYSDLLTHPKNKLWIKPGDI